MTRDDLISDEFPASWPMFGTDTRMTIGGYIKGDFVADFDGTLDSRQFLMRTIPVVGMPEFGGDPYVDFFANDTRFNLDIRRIIPGAVPLRGFIEGDFFTPDNNAVLEADGTLTTFPSFAAVFGFGYDWSPSWTTQGSYAYGVLDTPEARGPFELKAGGIGHLNLIWSPITSSFSAGAEIMYGKTRVQNDATGTATRFQLMAKYSF